MDRDLKANPYARSTEAGLYPDTVANPIPENPTRAILAEHDRRDRHRLLFIAGGMFLAAGLIGTALALLARL